MKFFVKTLSCITLSALLFAGTAFAQEPAKPKIDKKDTYTRNGFKSAIDKSKSTAADQPVSVDFALRMANSYRLTGDYGNAAFWYGRVVQLSNDPIYRLNFGQMLQATGNYADAKEQFLAYDDLAGSTDPRGREFAAACDNADRYKVFDNVEIENCSFNTNNIDFSPMFFRNGLIFASNRENPSNTAKRIDRWMNDYFVDLWYVEKDQTGAFQKASALSGEENGRFHDASCTFSQGGDVMYFTRNQYLGTKKKLDKKDRELNQGIYTANWNGTKFVNLKPFIHNNKDYDLRHPALSPDGTKLYFAGDIPGGMGDLDLFVSELEGGAWSAPRNLGPEINTAGNDEFPYVAKDGTLYFASDGHPGKGGLDIFYTSEKNNGASWSTPVNLGEPFNSSYDDFGIVFEQGETSGYFSSNRPAGHGQDDIYSFKIKESEAFLLNGLICVTDKNTGKRIPAANVEVLEYTMDGRLIESAENKYTTDDNGTFNYEMTNNRKYILKASKQGYLANSRTVLTNKYKSSQDVQFCVELDVPGPAPKNCKMLEGFVLNGSYNNRVIPNATVTVFNNCTGDQEVITTDASGYYSVCIECGCDFALKGEKAGFSKDNKKVTLSKGNCPPGNVKQDLTLYLAGMGPEIAEGDIIEIPNIYYDFDKYYIRTDAKPELDKVVAIMNQYPGLEIELGSHTDCRASDNYNKWLSQKRAEAAVAYITSKGISAKRITAKGYGESSLRNKCADGIECSEEDHQYNRRTEVRVTKFESMEKVKYTNNAPTYVDPKPGKGTKKSLK